MELAADHEEARETLTELVEPDVAQRLAVELRRARVLHLCGHAANRHRPGEQREQRVAPRVVRHRRLCHRHCGRVREHHRRVVMEHVLAAVDVVPPADVGANQVLTQHPLDGFLLQRELGALVQHLDLDRAARDAHRFFE